jgi:hypothetical protein
VYDGKRRMAEERELWKKRLARARLLPSRWSIDLVEYAWFIGPTGMNEN